MHAACASVGCLIDDDAVSTVALKDQILYNLCFTCETMIAYLAGKLREKEANTVIVDVGGVGYEVTIPLSTFYDLADEKSKVELLIYTHVKEDALQLYGFKTASEGGTWPDPYSRDGWGTGGGGFFGGF